ncbi:unnamed protein product [Prorocentrum cordatum]|uniref:Uncharacterized protein n=1 Tax=Prorocentrum cordatum TaxID=2364126 RepID=A0ABN9TKZ7_9DINO|nr:unnamed protein product [Polarella glacialis]
MELWQAAGRGVGAGAGAGVGAGAQLGALLATFVDGPRLSGANLVGGACTRTAALETPTHDPADQVDGTAVLEVETFGAPGPDGLCLAALFRGASVAARALQLDAASPTLWTTRATMFVVVAARSPPPPSRSAPIHSLCVSVLPCCRALCSRRATGPRASSSCR